MKKCICRFLFSSDSDSNPGLLALRVFTGIAMMTHGYGKLFVRFEAFAEGLGGRGFPIPAVLAFLTGFIEFFGGLFVALGFMTRFWALSMAVVMVIAAFVIHHGDPFAERELALFFLFVCFFLTTKGGGRFSADRLISGQLEN